jgi:hypothetical protein
MKPNAKHITKYTSPPQSFNGYRVAIARNGHSFRQYVSAKRHEKTVKERFAAAFAEAELLLNSITTLIQNKHSWRNGTLTSKAWLAVGKLGFTITNTVP